jgi:hypothetical protein
MDRRPIVVELDRRQLVTSLCAVGSLACLGCNRVLSVEEEKETPPHKFAAKSGMTFEEVYEFAFARGFIPLLTVLVGQIGLETIQDAASEAARLRAPEFFKTLATNDLAAWAAMLKEPDPLMDNAITVEIVEESEAALEVRVTECLWAKTFREADGADIGYACICHPDFAMAKAFNPNMRMIRDKTLMQGHSHCNHRWVMEV